MLGKAVATLLCLRCCCGVGNRRHGGQPAGGAAAAEHQVRVLPQQRYSSALGSSGSGLPNG